MKSFLRNVLMLSLLCAATSLRAADPPSPIDSLLHRAQAMPTPTQQVDSLNEWAWNFGGDSPGLALELATEALRIAEARHYPAGEATAHKRMGQMQRKMGNSIPSLIAYQNALLGFQQTGNQREEAIVLGCMASIFLDQEEFPLARRYFHQALQLNLVIGEMTNAVQQYNGLGIAHEFEERIDSAFYYYKMAANTATLIDDDEDRTAGLARAWNNLGSLFKVQHLPDSAATYWTKSRNAFAALGEGYISDMADPLNNLGLLEMERGNARMAIDSIFLPGLSIARSAEAPYLTCALYDNLSIAYEQLHQFDSALYYRNQYKDIQDTLFNQEKTEALAEVNTRYEVKEKDALNALLRAEGQQKTILITAISIVALLLMSLAALFIYTQRRRLQTQRELSRRQQQEDALRIVELVQTQELRSLESLVEGQERERNRMATELHDGLGSLLATVKLYFNQLDGSDASRETALKKADHLLDEACQEVRRYSHDLAGLSVVRFGLLNAVRDLADSISGAGKLQVRVYSHQMDERLPLPLERAVYKVVQELLTNAIKHAQATEVTIQLSRHSDRLNFILEDNGRGMDTKSQAPGLGLRSIRARVETLGGEFTLDSNPGHGTTALIDIPLEEEYHD